MNRKLLVGLGVLVLLVLPVFGQGRPAPSTPTGGTFTTATTGTSATWSGDSTALTYTATQPDAGFGFIGLTSSIKALNFIPVSNAGKFCTDISCTGRISAGGTSIASWTSPSGSTALELSGASTYLSNAVIMRGSSVQIGNNGTPTSGSPRGTAVLDFASALVNACSADLTITVATATTASEVFLMVPNASVAAGSVFFAWPSATDTVSVRHCCVAGVSCDPASGTFAARVFVP